MLRLAWNAAKSIWPEVKLVPLRAAVALGAAGLGEPVRPRQILRAYAIILPVGLLVWWLLSQLILVMSPSIDAWVVRRAPGPIARGDLISFRLVHPLAGPKPVGVTKYALCLPGDRIAMVEKPSPMSGKRDGWYYCNGRLLGVSKPVGHKGQTLTHWRPAYGRIPRGFAYVGSGYASSFDSRYYGPVELVRLTRMERVL
ncbi:S26 family signal peptidase [Sphingobium chungbukense]|uniref:Peptidase n=1 Tax=Sphingobium chungbukense TaxID=56193 RepID=A0A0M3ANN8_9SPHN|nr:S26 family signal peptidase [Sphingobium chungbukense]KKW90154.1 peptidase [Sphingobium chungbukense]